MTPACNDRHLSAEEQQVFASALRRSSRLVHKANKHEGMGCAFWACIGAVVTLGVWALMTIRGVGI